LVSSDEDENIKKSERQLIQLQYQRKMEEEKLKILKIT
jgi:hypothetical protein